MSLKLKVPRITYFLNFSKKKQEPSIIVQKFVWRMRVVTPLYIEPKNRSLYAKGPIHTNRVLKHYEERQNASQKTTSDHFWFILIQKFKNEIDNFLMNKLWFPCDELPNKRKSVKIGPKFSKLI